MSVTLKKFTQKLINAAQTVNEQSEGMTPSLSMNQAINTNSTFPQTSIGFEDHSSNQTRGSWFVHRNGTVVTANEYYQYFNDISTLIAKYNQLRDYCRNQNIGDPEEMQLVINDNDISAHNDHNKILKATIDYEGRHEARNENDQTRHAQLRIKFECLCRLTSEIGDPAYTLPIFDEIETIYISTDKPTSKNGRLRFQIRRKPSSKYGDVMKLSDRHLINMIASLGLTDYLYQEFPILKDVDRSYPQDTAMNLPIYWSDILQSHNLADYWAAKFKQPRKKADNHRYLNDVYVMHSLSTKLDSTSYRWLAGQVVASNQKHQPYFKATATTINRVNTTMWKNDILVNALVEHQTINPESQRQLSDCLTMLNSLHKRWHLGHLSIRGIRDWHNHLIELTNSKMLKTLSTKNVVHHHKFKTVIDHLTKNMQLLVSETDLAKEGIYMHHCVGSYYPIVEGGISCILHVTHNDWEATVEIRKQQNTKNPFYINQAYKAFDSELSDDQWAYLDNWLTDINIKTKTQRN